MEMKEDVVIVGGGIAGLATALALKRVGVRSLVLEKSQTLRSTGASLSFPRNAWVALDALGIAHKLTSIYTPFKRGIITDLRKGTRQEVIFPDIDKDFNGIRTVHRRVLLDALAEELPVDGIRFSSKLESIETLKHEGSTIAILRLEDGTIIKAKVVIGCDGVHSAVGKWLGLKDPIHSGRFAVRGLSVFPQGHGMKHEAQQFLDGATRAGVAPLNDKELYWFALFRKDITTKTPEFAQKSVLEDLAHFPQVFLDVVHHADLSTLSWAPLMFRVPWNVLLGNTYKDNITVAGDAMHPMTPDLAQGGCSALEDAVVLGRHIGNSYIVNGKINSSALKGYTEERRWRAALLITGSYLSGRIQQGGSGWLEFLRDKLFYKSFAYLTSNVVSYDCGKLPSAGMTMEENTIKKSE